VIVVIGVVVVVPAVIVAVVVVVDIVVVSSTLNIDSLPLLLPIVSNSQGKTLQCRAVVFGARHLV
jgi:hypothetical protein